MSAWFGVQRAVHKSKPALDDDAAARLARWQALPEVALQTPLAESRFAVVDIETSGLDIKRDHVLAVAALVVVRGTIKLDQSFYAVLKQPRPSPAENILIHRIGGEEQVAGVEAIDGLLGFLEFVGKTPLVAFHAPFDAIMLARACRQTLGITITQPWLDLAWLAPALMLDGDAKGRTQWGLDAWLDRIGVHISRRHHALADAMGTAQLLMALLARAAHARLDSPQALMKHADGQRWLHQRGLPTH